MLNLMRLPKLDFIGILTISLAAISMTGCLSAPFGDKPIIAPQPSTTLPPTIATPPVEPDNQIPNHVTAPTTSEATDQQPSDGSHDMSQSQRIQSSSTVVYRAQSPDPGGQDPTGQVTRIPTQGNPQSGVQLAARQYPELNAAPSGAIFSPGNQDIINNGSINTGAPNEMNPLVQLDPMGGVVNFPTNYADLDVYVAETQTGKINFGGAYNSENGIVGQFTIDERNFDIWAVPRSFSDIWNGNAWRGAGQTFRLELVPGREVQRYLVSFSEPYLFNTGVSFSGSAYLFDRRYFNWSEQRLGGRVALGYRLTQDLSLSAGMRMENVRVFDIRNVPMDPSTGKPWPTPNPNDLGRDPDQGLPLQLQEVDGHNPLYLAHIGLIRDTRDHPYMATEGTFFSMTATQGFGKYGGTDQFGNPAGRFSFTRGDFDFRKYWLMYQRPDGSGRHTVSYGTKLGISGTGAPIFENYFAGGFSTMRGFAFRGASPVARVRGPGPPTSDPNAYTNVSVGGAFQWLNTVEYMFPMTADDMVKGVLFCDYGTVENSISDWNDRFRVAPGFGFRVHMPAAGIGAPLAFDFAFPVSKSEYDNEQMFSFYMGVLR